MKWKGIKSINSVILLSIISLLTIVGVEKIYRETWTDLFQWLVHHPFSFLVELLLIISIVNIFFSLPKKWYIVSAFLMSSFLLVMSYISHIKTELRGEPLIPFDFLLKNEAQNISSYLQGYSLKGIGIILILYIIIGVLIAIMQPKKPYSKTRIIPSVLFFVLMVSILYSKPFPISESFRINVINFDQKLNTNQNGIVLGFALNLKWMKVEEPKEYNKEIITSILKESKKNHPKLMTETDKKPNIIFVMSEAFWDPTLIHDSWTKDPIPFFHQLQKKQTNGTLISPVFGGGTVNTEFEAITGMSTQFLPSGAIAYSNYMQKPIPTMATVLKEKGYQTTGIHTYHSWFYGRDKVYKNLGFDYFIGQEFFNNPKYRGEFIEDMELSKRIIEEVKKSKKSDYIYAVSMQAHGPYPLTKNKENTIQVTSPQQLTKEGKNILETYTQSISDADESLRYLVEELQKLDEPTMLVFYGDHLPMLGEDYKVYRELGYYDGVDTFESYLKMHSVPFVTWTNIKLPKETVTLSSNLLPSFILQQTQNTGDDYFDYLYTHFENGQKVTLNKKYADQNKTDKTFIQNYQTLQYDRLFGKQYTDHAKKLKKETENYYLGSEKPTLKRVVLDAVSIEGGIQYLEGTGFYASSVVYINDKRVETTLIEKNKLKINVPKKLIQGKKKVKIQLRVTDSLNHDLNQSNTLDVPVLSKKEFENQKRKQYQSIDISKNGTWEHFKRDGKIDIVRMYVGTTETYYSAFKGTKPLVEENADQMKKKDEVDLYPNGYLYISIDQGESGWIYQPTPEQINAFMKQKQYSLKVIQ